jgi:type IV pilus assembly protein PilN
MTVRINLLPHREERRQRQRRHFWVVFGVTVAAAAATWGVVHLGIAQMIDDQTGRNECLKKENAKLDKEIQEIKKLKEDIAALLARKQIIETLQSDRSQSVQLLDQLVRQTPDGVYLRGIKQEGLKVNVTGYAQSNARVSAFMRNVQSSAVIENPVLVEIKAAIVNNRRVSDFNLNFFIKRPKTDTDSGKPSGDIGQAPAKQG